MFQFHNGILWGVPPGQAFRMEYTASLIPETEAGTTIYTVLSCHSLPRNCQIRLHASMLWSGWIKSPLSICLTVTKLNHSLSNSCFLLSSMGLGNVLSQILQVSHGYFQEIHSAHWLFITMWWHCTNFDLATSVQNRGLRVKPSNDSENTEMHTLRLNKQNDIIWVLLKNKLTTHADANTCKTCASMCVSTEVTSA